ncbi:MAG: exodeoxyribonuclease VII large subunit [SAR202 cluster bacterium]|nr:exodeoxyribonuclease VII large subunit [SAR202 cluster bacterium]
MPLILTVSKVARYLKDILLSDTMLQDVWVSGEVGNFTRSAAGHSYFTLREGTSAALRCVMFRNAGGGANHLAEGAAVIVHGRIAIYEQRGDLQLIADVVQPEGVGELQLKLEALKAKLEKEGLFEPSRKRELPAFPVKIGVITSPTGAVWHDIQSIVSRRYPLVELVLAPTLVQGDAAAPGIAEAFTAMNAIPGLDLVILARGGGSMEDLWPFNEEAVARAIYTSRAPVVSAVGHETDFTIADMVADVRAPTPSAAAELAVPDRRELLAGIAAAARGMSAFLDSVVTGGMDDIERARARLDRAAPDFDTLRLRVDDLLKNAASQLRHVVNARSAEVESLGHRLTALSPRDILRRGYAIVEAAATGRIVTDASQLKPDDDVSVTLDKGGFNAGVKRVRD